MTYIFKSENTLQKRKEESEKIRKKHPDRVPIIVEKSSNCKNIPDIDKKKYLVPKELTIGQFQYVIRKRIKLDSQKALFIFINNKLPITSELLTSIYEKEKDEDGFLYITYASENTFG